MYDFDLVTLGSGPAGQRAAVQAAKLGKRVAVVEASHDLGGVCIQTGTIPSKTFREAVLALPERRRMVVVLRWRHQMSYAEIASVLGISVKTVEVQMGRALASLRKQLGHFTP